MTDLTTSRFEERQGLVTYRVTGREMDEAKKITRIRDKRNAAIDTPVMTRDRWIGALGEIVFGHYLDRIGVNSTWFRDDDLEFDFTVSGRAIETKTRNVNTEMKPHYEHNINARQAKSGSGDYFFLAYQPGRMRRPGRMWICGAMNQSEFMRAATLRKKGEPTDNPAMPMVPEDMLCIQQNEILRPAVWVLTLPPEAWPELAQF